MEKRLNALVHDYLTAVSPKAALTFKKEVKPKGLDEGIPRLKEIVNSINQTKQLNSLVYIYLTDKSLTAAKIFRKDVKPKELEEGTPSLKEIVESFNKRKLKRRKETEAEAIGSSAKQAKINSEREISSDVDQTSANEVSQNIFAPLSVAELLYNF